MEMSSIIERQIALNEAIEKLCENKEQAQELALNEALEKLWESKSKELMHPTTLKDTWDEFFMNYVDEWREELRKLYRELAIAEHDEDEEIDRMMEIAYDYYY